MTAENLPRRDGPSTAFRVGRAVVVTALGVVSAPFVVAGVALVRLAFGPLDVTPIARHFMPIALQQAEAGQTPPARIVLDGVTFAWPVLMRGVSTPLIVSVREMKIIDTTGAATNVIAHGDVAFDMRGLAHGRVALRELALSGARFALVRRPDGTIGLDMPGLRQGGGAPPINVEGLHAIRLDRSTVVVRDEIIHQTVTVTSGDTRLGVEHFDGRLGVTGAILATVSIGAWHTTLHGQGSLQPDHGGVNWALSLDRFRPSGLAQLAPRLGAIDIPVTASAQVVARPGADPAMLVVAGVTGAVELGRGAFTQSDGTMLWVNSGALRFHVAAGKVTGNARPVMFEFEKLSLRLDRDGPDVLQSTQGVQLDATGTLRLSDLLAPRRVDATISAGISTPVPFADLPHYWPLGVANGARKWVTHNITAGIAEGLHADVTLGGNTGWSRIKAISVQGGLWGHGLQIYWLRPVPPINDLDARLVFDGPDALRIDFDNGFQDVIRTDRNVGASGMGKLVAGRGSMVITHLDAKNQIGTVSPHFSGNLRDVLALLAEPRLHLLSRHPLSFTQPSGNADIAFTLTLPLTSKVTIAQMSLQAHGRATNVHLGNVVLGRAVTNGNVDLDATMERLDIKGDGQLGGVPSRVKYTMDFASIAGVHVTDRAHVDSDITPMGADGAGIPASAYFTGMARLGADYERQSDGAGSVRLALNMRDAAVMVPLWRKPAGRSAVASVTLDLAGGHLARIHDLAASGPDLSLTGSALVDNGVAKTLQVADFHVGRSRGRAQISIPWGEHDPIKVSVNAPVMDLSPLFGSDHKDQQPPPRAHSYQLPQAASGKLDTAAGRAWAISMNAQKLYYSRDGHLGGVRASLVNDGRRLTSMDFQISVPTDVSATLQPGGTRRHAHIAIGDLGLLLNALDIVPNIRGGAAAIEGYFDDAQASAPFHGALRVGPFVLQNAPGALRFANQLSVYGWTNGLPTSDFPVDHLKMPLDYRDGIFTISDGEASNASLGATLRGKIDGDRAIFDLHGTVTPVFAINSLPGKVPGLGRLFSPEKGAGVLSATYSITGPFAQPDVRVNPFAVLLPGFLRQLVE